MATLPALTLYTREGCHLCEEMKLALEELQSEYSFPLNLVDIDADPYLRLRYGERIPVLAAGEEEICHYHFNRDLILNYFRKC